ncbi:MerR family transcriptional regulator [Haloechinothrix salitolerans]|uniref:MerR family transcriptional regulator n=1 Tax=Haloechinothrix salitolerans TaxID=926830 RepID=A0ABW2C033_9PSEU
MPRNRDNHEESDEPELVPSGTLAKRVGVTARTIARYVEDGSLKPTEWTAGGHSRWDLEDGIRQWREVSAEKRRAKKQQHAKKREERSQK